MVPGSASTQRWPASPSTSTLRLTSGGTTKARDIARQSVRAADGRCRPEHSRPPPAEQAHLSSPWPSGP